MNAALESDNLAGVKRGAGGGSGGDEEVVWAWRLWDQVAIHHLSAFGGGRQEVQDADKAAAKSFHAREGVGFAAQILKVQSGAFVRANLVGNESPGSDGCIAGE